MGHKYHYRIEFHPDARRAAEVLGLGIEDLETAVRERIDGDRYAGTTYETDMIEDGFDSFEHAGRAWICLFNRTRVVSVDAVVSVKAVEAAGLFEEAEVGFPIPGSWR